MALANSHGVKKVKGPAPSERNRCLGLSTTRSFWNSESHDRTCRHFPIQRSKFGEKRERKVNS